MIHPDEDAMTEELRRDIAGELADEILDDDRVETPVEDEWPPLPIETVTKKYRKCLRRMKKSFEE